MSEPEYIETKRYSPYKNFKFIVSWDGQPVAGVNSVSGLTKTTEVVEYRSGGEPSSSHRSPGQTSYGAITLERGVTHDEEFEKWATKVWAYGHAPGSEVSLADFRKDITIELQNEAGQPVVRYLVYRCWVSEYTAMGDLDASGNDVLIQSLQLENEGWERDTALEAPEPAQYD